LGFLFDKLANVISLFAAVKFLSPAEFGKASILYSISLATASLLAWGLATDIAREKRRIEEKICCYTYIYLVITLILFIIILFIGDYIFTPIFEKFSLYYAIFVYILYHKNRAL